MYSKLLLPNNADLALLFGKSFNRTSSLYSKAKYIWEIPEYKDWGVPLDNIAGSKNWRRVLLEQRGVKSHALGGVIWKGRVISGSGAIVPLMKTILWRKLKNIPHYTHVVVTRPDQFYTRKIIINPSRNIIVPEGEDYGGICDRWVCVPWDDIPKTFNILRPVVRYPRKHRTLIRKSNPERLWMHTLKTSGLFSKIKRVQRFCFTAYADSDKTRWNKQMLTRGKFLVGISAKYPKEYQRAIFQL